LEAVSRLLRGIVNTGFGQAFDITLQAEGGGTEQDVFDLHLAKTAIYTYENPLHIGAILAGGQEDDLELLSEYARPGGIAFQLQDDMLGLFGDPDETGKSDFSDLIQRKVTQLVIKALELANDKQKARLLELWGKKDVNVAEAEEFRQLIAKTGSLDYSRATAVKFAEKAKAVTLKMRAKGWDSEAVDYLEGIAQYMIEREV
jgi:geranylgeranyl diphosphate synthase type I